MDDDGGKGGILWQSILSDVQSHTSGKRQGTKNLLILGDEGSGKSSLLLRLQGRKQHVEDYPQGTGLEYTYLDVRDEENSEDVLCRLGAYTLCGNEESPALLNQIISKDNLKNTVAMIVLDFSRPWLMMQSLTKWAGLLNTAIQGLELGAKLDELKNTLIKKFQMFVETDVSDNNKVHNEIDVEEQHVVTLDLEEGACVDHLGIPLVIVCNKTDFADNLVKHFDYRPEHFDFIQYQLRLWCLRYGASLIYVSKDAKNKDVLYRYLLHQAYNFSAKPKANIIDMDITFVPSGFDNMAKIGVLCQGMQTISPSDVFTDVIRPPVLHNSVVTREVAAENEQDFLAKQRDFLTREAPANAKSSETVNDASHSRRQPMLPTKQNTTASPGTGNTRTPPSGTGIAPPGTGPLPAGVSRQMPNPLLPTAGGVPVKGLPPVPGAALGGLKDGKNQGEVLANFFNSLLNKKTSAGAAAPPPSEGAK